MAERSPVYAELRNLIDLAIAAAYIQQQDYCAKAGWKMAFFGSEKAFPVETYDIPKTVESAVNAIWKGSTLMTPIGGGVQIQPPRRSIPTISLRDEKGKVSKLREAIKPEAGQGPVVVGLTPRCGRKSANQANRVADGCSGRQPRRRLFLLRTVPHDRPPPRAGRRRSCASDRC